MLIFSSRDIEGRIATPAIEQPFTACTHPLAQVARKHAPQMQQDD